MQRCFSFQNLQQEVQAHYTNVGEPTTCYRSKNRLVAMRSNFQMTAPSTIEFATHSSDEQLRAFTVHEWQLTLDRSVLRFEWGFVRRIWALHCIRFWGLQDKSGLKLSVGNARSNFCPLSQRTRAERVDRLIGLTCHCTLQDTSRPIFPAFWISSHAKCASPSKHHASSVSAQIDSASTWSFSDAVDTWTWKQLPPPRESFLSML